MRPDVFLLIFLKQPGRRYALHVPTGFGYYIQALKNATNNCLIIISNNDLSIFSTLFYCFIISIVLLTAGQIRDDSVTRPHLVFHLL